eukprot:UN29530
MVDRTTEQTNKFDECTVNDSGTFVKYVCVEPNKIQEFNYEDENCTIEKVNFFIKNGECNEYPPLNKYFVSVWDGCSSIPIDCSKIVDPCFCTDKCGWSSNSDSCVEGGRTDCSECATLTGCVKESCDKYVGVECPEYDPMKTCQCDDSCAENSNCCRDVSLCGEPTGWVETMRVLYEDDQCTDVKPGSWNGGSETTPYEVNYNVAADVCWYSILT